jgi:hypothetical protein
MPATANPTADQLELARRCHGAERLEDNVESARRYDAMVARFGQAATDRAWTTACRYLDAELEDGPR